jgi:hypothetical protein
MKLKAGLLLLISCLSAAVLASDPHVEPINVTGNRFENNILRIRLAPRTPNQIAAFYEARGFPSFAIDEVRKVCFITVGLANKSDMKLYHDLKQWHFTDSKGPVQRLLRPYWTERWNQLGLAKRFQSTFRWTLLPENLDFYPQEGEGGNLIFPRTGRSITIQARIRAGEPGKQVIYQITFNNVNCVKDNK